VAQIHVLPDLLVNKIAAGEVVERPASVVKELLENAVDGGAGHIEVMVEEGGRRLIRVADDGSGMSPDQLRLAVMPHATSKITIEEDLYHIGTLGFRGEALASIGAVSRLRLVSRPHDSDEGGEIRVAGEQIESCSAAGCPPGTTVEVRDLFFNVPARRKFLRTTATETGHVNEQTTRIALARPDIGLELSTPKRVTHRLPPDQSRLDRIGELFGPELAEELIVIRRDERGLDIEAYAAPPARSRSTAAGQYIFVNGRYIRDRVINYAIREAYRGLMEHDRYPVVFLFLTIDPEAVDANVHPTKIEVRWQDANLIRSQVLSAFRETLLRSDLTPALRTDRPGSRIDAGQREEIRRRMAEEFKSAAPVSAESSRAFYPAVAPSEGRGSAPGGPPLGRGSGPPGQGPADLERAAEALWQSLYPPPGDTIVSPADDTGAMPAAPDESLRAGEPASSRAGESGPRRAIQLHNTYLVSETEDGLIIIDQHALHERVIYEQLRRRLTSGPLESQRLLLPETLEATAHQMALLQNHADLLHKLGIEVTPFGTGAVAVQSFPALLVNADVRGFLRDLIDKLDEKGDAAHTEEVIHELLDMMACKAAVKAGDPLTPDEIDALIAAKDLIDKSSNCPHGRPTTLRMNLRDLERQFKRT